jgi:RNA polymerase sigma-70 factor (ECF subfamily)
MAALPIVQNPPQPRAAALDAAAVHAAHSGFLWATLQRLGGRARDLDDLYQEVFVVVHRRLGDYDPALPIRPWLFGICVRVVAASRRRAHVRREELVDVVPEGDNQAPSPEERADRARNQKILARILDELDLERRAVFVMYEIDEVPCEQIAEMIGVPVGTVHSRLHTARKEFQRAAARWQAAHGGAPR